MATDRIKLTEGAGSEGGGKNAATHTFTEDTLLKHLQRIVPSTPAGQDQTFGAGSVAPGTPRFTHATDDPAVVALAALLAAAATATNQEAMLAALQSIAADVASEDSLIIGAVNEPAPATDTASSALNGRLQRLAQRLTTLITALGLPAQAPSATAPGITASRVKSAASTNATAIKASAGNIYSIDVFNNSAAAKFLKLYNKASAPTVGTDTPVLTIPIPPGGGFSKYFTHGRAFATGIAYAITNLVADSDTTAVAVDDVTGSIGWF